MITHTLRKTAERLALNAFGIARLRRAAMRLAARRQHGLILLYHRIDDETSAPQALVHVISPCAFRQQLEALADLGDVVPLAQLLDGRPPEGRVRFAITFDDDHPSHVAHAVPILESLGLHATFFLSGRDLHGLGPYWWELLETARHRGHVARLAQALGVPARTPHDLADACLRSPSIAERLYHLVPVEQSRPRLTSDGIARLARAGHEIGFHTLHHPLLTTLSPGEIDRALTEGRDALAGAAGVALRFFAYPHGSANAVVAQRTGAAGYLAAFTNIGHPVHPGGHRFLIGRWDVRTRDLDEFVRSVVLRLSLPASRQSESPA